MRINWAERVAAAAAAGCAVSPGHFCVCARVVFAVTELKFFCAACVYVCVNSTPRLGIKPWLVWFIPPQVWKKLSKHERQGDSLTEGEGGYREEGAWETP